MKRVVAPAPAGAQLEQARFGRGAPHFGERQLEIAADDMQIVAREKQEVAGLDFDDLAPVGETRETRSIGQQMEEHDVVRVRQSRRRGVEPVLRRDTPRRRELGVDINRPVEADGR